MKNQEVTSFCKNINVFSALVKNGYATRQHLCYDFDEAAEAVDSLGAEGVQRFVFKPVLSSGGVGIEVKHKSLYFETTYFKKDIFLVLPEQARASRHCAEVLHSRWLCH